MARQCLLGVERRRLEEDVSLEIIPEVPVNDPQEPEDACSYCCHPNGRKVRKARNTLHKRYVVNGAKIDFVFMLCELCRFSRGLFPAWDARMQALRIGSAVVRLRDRYA